MSRRLISCPSFGNIYGTSVDGGGAGFLDEVTGALGLRLNILEKKLMLHILALINYDSLMYYNMQVYYNMLVYYNMHIASWEILPTSTRTLRRRTGSCKKSKKPIPQSLSVKRCGYIVRYSIFLLPKAQQEEPGKQSPSIKRY